MALSDKNVLAARSLVMLATVLHSLSFIAEGIALGELSRFELQCLSDMRHPILNSSKWIMWVHLGARMVATFAPIPTIWRLILRLDEIEHAPRRGSQVQEAKTWETLPATLFTNYLVFASFVLVQVASAFRITAENFAESRRNFISEWGQSAALIVAGVAITHVGYVFFTLFRQDAMERRLSVCKINKHSIAWRHPQWPLTFGIFSKYLKQRSPFAKIAVHAVDELLVDTTQLHRHHELNLSKEEQDVLWQELLDAFRMNDLNYILDCLNRGAPVNRCEMNSKEYCIHMAARFGNLEVLRRLLPPGETLQIAHCNEPVFEDFVSFYATPLGRLLTPNADSQTPLTVAVGANQLEAFRWLLKRLRERHDAEGQPHSEAQKCVIEALTSILRSSKLNMLKDIAKIWPNWNELKLAFGSERVCPCEFALRWGIKN